MTTNLAETIAGLEKYIKEHPLSMSMAEIETLESALAHLRSQEETVRRCAEICEKRAKPGLHPWILDESHQCAAAILAAHGLKE